MKKCTKCLVEKTLDQFAIRKDRPSGRASSCKACLSAHVVANRDKTKHAQDRAAHRKARPDLSRAASKRYWDANPEYRAVCAERIKKWCADNPEKALAARKDLGDRHPERPRIYQQNRRAKIRKNGGALTPRLANFLMLEQGGKCPYCTRSIGDLTHNLDHYIPVALGGPNEDWNIQLVCPPCNKKKSDKHPLSIDMLKIWHSGHMEEFTTQTEHTVGQQ